MQPRQKKKNIAELRKTVLAWLSSSTSHPDGIAYDMSTRLMRDRVDLCALWFKTPSATKKHDASINAKTRAALYICCPMREDCWPECSNAEEIAYEIASLRTERESVEAEIRASEPDLRDREILFEELSIWKYELSANTRYHEIQERIAALELMLYRGTRMEHISENPIAEQLYLVVNEGMLKPEEIREDWGLIYINNSSVEIARQAKRHTVADEDKNLLIIRMLASNMALATSQIVRKHKKNTKKATNDY